MDTLTWPDWAHLKWVGPAVRPTLPPASFFKFPPASEPPALHPPVHETSVAYPFNIPEDWYNAFLDPVVPITVALVYASVITFLNSVNKNRKYKPWAISKTSAFKIFVLAHNAFLAGYSAWTFVGMFHALRHSIASPRGPYGMAGTVDSFCKMHGPRGLGSAATFDPTTESWGLKNNLYHLAQGTQLPDRTDVGRLWNEGLAFYGWLFYLSKFYEVIDTLIIIAKGKKSSFLQTYHHAGAMLSMWAGIRYMSPAIWMFAFVNSFIHTIMYSFYFVTALGYRIPKPIKRTLTTMQITQFVVGVNFAFAHLFVEYQVPVSTPYIYHLGDTLRSIASSISSDAASAVAAATSPAIADKSAWLKKLALRAAGREGLAENVWNEYGQTFGVDAVHATKDFARREETRYRDELQWVHCLDTSGQTFAVYLNIFYLLPLTWLFAQFFVKAYLERAEKRRRSSLADVANMTKESLFDARKGLQRRVSEAFEDFQGVNGNGGSDSAIIDGDEIRKEIKSLAQQGRSAGNKAVKKTKDAASSASDKVSNIDTEKSKQSAQEELQKLRDQAKAGATKAKSTASDVTSQTSKAVDDAASKTKETADNVSSKVAETYEESTSQETKETIEETSSTIMENLSWASQRAQSLADEAMQRVIEAGKSAQKSTEKKIEEVKEEVDDDEGWIQSPSKKSKKKAGQVKDTAVEKAQQGSEQAKSAAQNVKETVSKKTEESKSSTSHTSSSTTSQSTTSGSNAPSKAEQDKIIDTSQVVRDEDVDAKGSPTNDLDASYTEVAAEGVGEGEKLDIRKSDGADINSTAYSHDNSTGATSSGSKDASLPPASSLQSPSGIPAVSVSSPTNAQSISETSPPSQTLLSSSSQSQSTSDQSSAEVTTKQTLPEPASPTLSHARPDSAGQNRPVTPGRIRRQSSAFKVEFFPRSPTTTTSLHTTSADRHPTPSPTLSRSNTGKSTGGDEASSKGPGMSKSTGDLSDRPQQDPTTPSTVNSTPSISRRDSPHLPRRNTGQPMDINTAMRVDTGMRVDPEFRVDTGMTVDPSRQVLNAELRGLGFDTDTTRKLQQAVSASTTGRKRTPSPVKKTAIPAPVLRSSKSEQTDSTDNQQIGGEQAGSKAPSSPVKGRQWHSRRRGVRESDSAGADGSNNSAITGADDSPQSKD